MEEKNQKNQGVPAAGGALRALVPAEYCSTGSLQQGAVNFRNPQENGSEPELQRIGFRLDRLGTKTRTKTWTKMWTKRLRQRLPAVESSEAVKMNGGEV